VLAHGGSLVKDLGGEEQRNGESARRGTGRAEERRRRSPLDARSRETAAAVELCVSRGQPSLNSIGAMDRALHRSRGNEEQRGTMMFSRGAAWVAVRREDQRKDDGIFPWLTTARSRRSRGVEKGRRSQSRGPEEGRRGRRHLRWWAASYAAVGGVLCGGGGRRCGQGRGREELVPGGK
jgi:hypothetical protein